MRQIVNGHPMVIPKRPSAFKYIFVTLGILTLRYIKHPYITLHYIKHPSGDSIQIHFRYHTFANILVHDLISYCQMENQ